MAGGLFKKIFGNSTGASTVSPLFVRKFGKLAEGNQRLMARAENFVQTGDNRVVLSELPAAIQTASKNQRYFNLRGEDVYAHHLPGQPDALARFAELTVAMRTGNPSYYRRDHVNDIPPAVVSLFDLLGSSGGTDKTNRTTLDDLRDAARILGASDGDVANLLITSGYSSRQIFLADDVPGRKLLETLPAKAFIAAYNTRDVDGKVSVLETIRDLPVAKDLELLDFLFAQSEAGSSKIREAAIAVMPYQNPLAVQDRAITMLNAGKATSRASAVAILGGLQTPAATAALQARRDKEKTQSIIGAIDLFLGTGDTAGDEIAGGYVDVHGDTVTVPDLEPLPDEKTPPLPADLLSKLQAADTAYHEERLERHKSQIEFWIKNGKRHKEPGKPQKIEMAKKTLAELQDALNGKVLKEDAHRVSWGYRPEYNRIIGAAIADFPIKAQLGMAVRFARVLTQVTSYAVTPMAENVMAAVDAGKLDLRHLLRAAEAVGLPLEYGGYQQQNSVLTTEVSYLHRQLNPPRYSYDPDGFLEGTWIIAVTHFDMVLDALPPRSNDATSINRALMLLDSFPSLPRVALQPVLFCAIDDRNKIRTRAQKLLAGVPGISEQLIGMLNDTRQAVRANAAGLLADRDTSDAVPALTKRLKKEKSEMARAAMISAVDRLGGKTDAYLGQSVLLKEAQTFVAKLPNAKLDWLDLSTAPALVWAGGKTADPAIADGWLRLALKLKTPGGSPLFGLYFDQMTPDSVTAFCDWVLASWLSYDTHRPASDELRKRAHDMATAELARPSSYYAKSSYWTVDNLAQMYLQNMLAGYPNSGADSKGILALTHRATPTRAVQLIGTYLKQHGKRVSQAKALVETLAGMGTQEALQLLVATSTRFKQRSVRETAAAWVADIAEARGWTEDELADRSIPSGGFEEDGAMMLEVGEDAKPYVARLGSDLTVKLFNPDGKEVKAIPAGKDANTKDSKALLSAAKKTVKEATTRQKARLYDAMLGSRTWRRSDWQSDLASHPIMQRLIERVIWRGLDADGKAVATFRPTAEGDILDAAGDDVDISAFDTVDLAHTTNMPDDARTAWLTHYEDFEVTPLFPQITRPVHTLTDDLKKETALKDREGWLMTTFQLRSATTKAGFERGPVEDGAGFYLYLKEFRSAGLTAHLEFTGSYLPEEEMPAAIVSMQFMRKGARRAVPVPLGEVPPLLLSEVWADLHDIAKPGAFDPDWRKKGLM